MVTFCFAVSDPEWMWRWAWGSPAWHQVRRGGDPRTQKGCNESVEQATRFMGVRFNGLRPGEKRYEELITEGEGIVNTHHAKIMVLRGDRVTPCRELHEQIDRLAARAREMDCHGIKEGLQEIVPEYTADFSSC